MGPGLIRPMGPGVIRHMSPYSKCAKGVLGPMGPEPTGPMGPSGPDTGLLVCFPKSGISAIFFQTLESLPQSQGRWPLAAVRWCSLVAGWQHQGEQDRLARLIWARVGPVGPMGIWALWALWAYMLDI